MLQGTGTLGIKLIRKWCNVYLSLLSSRSIDHASKQGFASLGGPCEDEGQALTVLYIMGAGRSGTTLLGRILGEHEGIIDVGEMRFLWERGILEARSCGCGRPIPDCPLWSRIIDEVSDGPDPASFARRMRERQRRYLRLADTWSVLRLERRSLTQRSQARKAALDDYARTLRATYEAVAHLSGASVVVDTSKLPAEAAVVARLSGISPHFVHMVRDPRAVAYSWLRPKVGIRSMSLTRIVLGWLINNAGCRAITHRFRDRVVLVRYEDFIASPRRHAELVIDRLGGYAGHSPFLANDVVSLGVHHTVSGNPDRFATGPTSMRLDDEWRSRLPWYRKTWVAMVTWPCLYLYRYLPGRLFTKHILGYRSGQPSDAAK